MVGRFLRYKPLFPRAHFLVDTTGGTGNVGAWWLLSGQHFPGIAHLRVVPSGEQAIPKSIPSEIAPVIAAATQVLSIPVNLRLEPQLMANILFVVFALLLEIFFPGSGGQVGFLQDPIGIPHGRIGFVPVQLENKFHAQFPGHLFGEGNFMLVVAENDELPDKVRCGRGVKFLETIELFHVTDDPVEIASNAILLIGLLACSIDGAAQYLHAAGYNRFQHFVRHMIEIDAIAHAQLDALFVTEFDDIQKFRIQENFAEIGELDDLEVGIGFNELAKVLKLEHSASHCRINFLGRRRT